MLELIIIAIILLCAAAGLGYYLYTRKPATTPGITNAPDLTLGTPETTSGTPGTTLGTTPGTPSPPPTVIQFIQSVPYSLDGEPAYVNDANVKKFLAAFDPTLISVDSRGTPIDTLLTIQRYPCWIGNTMMAFTNISGKESGDMFVIHPTYMQDLPWKKDALSVIIAMGTDSLTLQANTNAAGNPVLAVQFRSGTTLVDSFGFQPAKKITA